MKIRHFLGCLLAVAGLTSAGCAAHTDDYRGGATTAAGTVAHTPIAIEELETPTVDEHLAQLDALELFDVGELLVGLPEMATSCYGVCPEWTALSEAEQQAEIDALRESQEARLEGLVAIAADVHAEEDAVADPAEVERHLQVLRALRIVEVGEFVLTTAENNPYCYNLPCAEDVARAEEANAARAGEIAAIAARAEGL